MRPAWETRIGLIGLLVWTSPAVAVDDPEQDYGRRDIAGMKGHIYWESMLHGDGLDGWQPSDSLANWTREGNVVIVDAAGAVDATRLIQGDASWDALRIQSAGHAGARSQFADPLRDI